MKKITIAVADDHKLIRQMWTNLFAGNSTIQLIGESGTYDETIEMIKIKRPDILLLDINLHEASGMDAVPVIRKFSPGTRIIAVSMHSEPAYAKKMLQLGARGYVTKNSSQEEVLEAIEEVMKGELYMCLEIRDILSDLLLNEEQDKHDTKNLSFRQIQIIKCIKAGLSSKEIGTSLNIATRTVEVHRHNILKKLKLKNTASLINYINTSHLAFI